MSRKRCDLQLDEIRRIEQAINDIVTWATRNDVQSQAMEGAQCDLTRTHLWLLHRLDENAAIRLSELALAVGLEPSTLSPQVQSLERRGLVERESDPKDGRASLLRVTRSGRTLLARVRATRRRMFAELLATWPDDERSQVAAYLTRLAGALAARSAR